MKQLAEEGGFAIRSIQYDEAGKESMRMEVTSIDTKSLGADLFAFPADWAKQDMSAMQERMKAMREQKGQGKADLSRMLEDMISCISGCGPASPAGSPAPRRAALRFFMSSSILERSALPCRLSQQPSARRLPPDPA
jgi:hypothetical protein